MKTQIKALVILFLTVTFSAFAGQPTLNEDPIIAVFQGFDEKKGFIFTVGEGEEAKQLAFPKVEDVVLTKVNLKDNGLVGKTYELVVEEHDGLLHLKSLKEVKK